MLIFSLCRNARCILGIWDTSILRNLNSYSWMYGVGGTAFRILGRIMRDQIVLLKGTSQGGFRKDSSGICRAV